MTLETYGYPCGCVYHVEGGYVVKAEFCPKHRVVKEVLLEGLE